MLRCAWRAFCWLFVRGKNLNAIPLGQQRNFYAARRLALGGGAHIMFHEVSMARENASREFRRSVKSMGETRDRSIRRTEFRASL
jgi:hypothetical protein